MKKYITLAALLAAGTACVNADVIVKDLNSSTDVYDVETGILSTEGLFSSAVLTNNDQSATYYAASATIKLNLTNLGFVGESSYAGEDAVLVEYRAGEATNNTIGLAATEVGLKLTWAGSVWNTLSSHYISWDALKNDSFVEGNSTFVTLTLESSFALDAPNGGTFVYKTDGTAHVSAASSTSAKFGASTLRSTAVYDSIYLNKDYVSAVYVTPGAATVEQIKMASSVVPEPSAFGMLAGLGALALVVSRRRRK